MIYFFAGNVGSACSHAIIENEILEISGNRLLSFAYREQEKKSFEFWLGKKKDSNKRLFLDCGAFTACAQGYEIDINEYIEFVKKNEKSFFCCASLDEIGNAEQSRKNHEYMLDKGVNSMPTFHLGSDLKELEMYCENSKYVAIGKIIPLLRNKEKLVRSLDQCWSIIKKYWPIKIHAFGIMNPLVLTKYPFYSCDSTTAIYNGSFGVIMNFDGFNVKKESWRSTEITGRYGSLMDSNDGSKYSERRIHNVREMVKLERYFTRLWTHKGIVWKE